MSDNKGYGFIECEGKDYFVHYSCIRNEGKTLSNGAQVSFRIIDGRKGPLAEEVELLN
ncbi:cold-shock protein [Legionella sp. km772]|uniref:cold-shock protein n=1 Tax=Legionella sp. km772 TaxID=2498111 RepID=UPI000F8F50D7|nr:cold shock domain-containing protein [Legionella sp. km772]RUR04435.1 cold shock domain-containing protein [Legionella sp. km772]